MIDLKANTILMSSSILSAFTSFVFFAVYYFYGMFTASITLSVLSAIQLLAVSLGVAHVNRFEKINLIAVSVFGLLTWWFHNERYLQWKVSIIHLGLAGALIAYRRYTGHTVFSQLLAAQNMVAPDEIALTVDRAFAGFFMLVSIINIFVFMCFSLDSWVYFKSLLFVFNAIFFVMVTVFAGRHIKPLQHAK